MHLIETLLVLLLAAGISPETIPNTHAETFAGQQVVFPDALHGKVGLLVVSFSKNGGGVAAGWGQRLGRDFGSDARIGYYQLVVLTDVPGLLRGFVVHSIKSSVPKQEHPRFVPIYQDEQQWKQVTQYQQPDDAYVVVLNKDMQVAYRTHGQCTDAQYRELVENLKTLLNQADVPPAPVTQGNAK